MFLFTNIGVTILFILKFSNHCTTKVSLIPTRFFWGARYYTGNKQSPSKSRMDRNICSFHNINDTMQIQRFQLFHTIRTHASKANVCSKLKQVKNIKNHFFRHNLFQMLFSAVH